MQIGALKERVAVIRLLGILKLKVHRSQIAASLHELASLQNAIELTAASLMNVV